LVVSGCSAMDALPEAIELPGRRFVLGVQWHPEADETSKVVGALVAEAARGASGGGDGAKAAGEEDGHVVASEGAVPARARARA
jgi:putative glutamine amidotransferase